ncbi:breast carcinoma-amplified sequence 4-like [Anneissia japonica]|uniref:breast carcinoma-amplified sequence 4-like n=1 Tax=Anneissia japonica TaxID=1529436 RepID=UPI00142595A3|nr:breast carcinoma-amplified sequence 4-like [Anneissia japonica]XP_033119732.1 breast carcinoma-amplified sequence 4-like [Anneissia japonica]
MAEEKEVKKKNETLSTEEIIEETAHDYSQFFITDPLKEKQAVEEKIEEMLTKLDEFCAVVDIIRSEASLSLNHCLPEITAKMNQMQELFKQIDQLEAFVGIVKENVTMMEEQVNQAEKDLGGMKTLKGFLNSIPLFSQKSSTHKNTTVKKYTQPEIFRAKDYFVES